MLQCLDLAGLNQRRKQSLLKELNESFQRNLYDSLPPPVSCEISDFIGYKNSLFGFHVLLQNQEKT